MTDHRREVHRSQISKDAFLFSRTDSQPRTEYPEEQDAPAVAVMEQLPEAPDEIRLLETAMDRLESVDRFGAMAVRVDDIQGRDGLAAVIGDLTGILDDLSNEADGIWGMIDYHVFGCFFPDADEAACQKTADHIRRRLADCRPETVTIGIAIYPTIVYEKIDILANAKKALDHAEFFGPDSCVAFDSVSLNISGDKYYQDGDIDGAMAEYNLALTLDPENVNVHNSLGVCHGVRGDLDLALAAFKIALRIDPNEILSLYNAGYINLLKGAYSTALEFFQRAERIDGNIFEHNFQTGRVLLELERPAEAGKYLERAIALNGRSGMAYRLLGDCHLALDRLPDAASAYNTALKLRPDDATAISSLAYCYEMQGQNAEIAMVFCQRAIEMEPESGLFHYRLGRVLFNRNRLDEALAEFETALECGYDATEYIHKTRDLLSESHEKQNTDYS